jgi:hypothetical protein
MLGGIAGILPDTLDFKFARYSFSSDAILNGLFVSECQAQPQ